MVALASEYAMESCLIGIQLESINPMQKVLTAPFVPRAFCLQTSQNTMLFGEDDGPSFMPAMMLALLLNEETNRKKSWKQKNLTLEGRRRRDRRYPRAALRHYKESPFRYLYVSQNDQALLNATGVDYTEFGSLLQKIQPIFDGNTINEATGCVVTKQNPKKGRKRSIDAIGVLGLVLMWYRRRVPSIGLCPLYLD
jgi:hypothetical protein